MKVGTHPLNLAFRFVLELSSLFALGLWGWRYGQGPWRILIAVALPLIAGALWGTFAVPGDPSRSGSAPIPVPGAVRLAIELAFFASAAAALYSLRFAGIAALFGAAILIHYLASYDRIGWLLSR